ncbi:MAG: YceI family protein [Acidimicrobiia bacterium]|nr:YceI family protein [Acidimicrobiia bacterium]MDH4307778.1 YceI family protein [Acidimicrobiia bacterium]
MTAQKGSKQMPANPEPGKWELDPTHTVVGFVARHLMVTKVRGSFKAFSGTIDMGENAETSSVEVSIDAASIDTATSDRDDHIRSADFLDVENHPSITFKSTGVRASGSGYEVDGDLTIREVTRPVTLSLGYDGTVVDPWGNTRAGFTASTTIDREDWGLTWNVPLDAGGVLVSKDIKIEIEVEAVRAA